MQQSTSNLKKTVRVPDLPMELLRDQCSNTTYNSSAPPPFYSTTERLVDEQKNSDPCFLRSTMYIPPSSEFTMESCGIPFALAATPFSDRGFLEPSSGADTCNWCRSVFNSFSRVMEKAIVCNICQKKTENPLSFPENIKKGSFEFRAPLSGKEASLVTLEPGVELEYPPSIPFVSPILVFLFDMSQSGLVHSILNEILSIVQDSNFKLLYKNIGIFVLGKEVLGFSGAGGKCIKYRMPGSLPFISSKLTVKCSEVDVIKEIIEDVRRISYMDPPSSTTVMETIKNTAAFATGCKIVLVSSSPMLLDYENVLKARKNCTINLFYERLTKGEKPAALEKLAFYSSGHIFRYDEAAPKELVVDLRNTCLRRSVFNVKLVLRVSDNLSKLSVVGATMDEGIVSSHFNSMDPSTTVLFNLAINSISKDVKFVQLQASYIDFDGSRKIRVFNHVFPTGTPAQMFTALSFDTLFAAMAKLSISEDFQIEKSLTDALVYYKNKCSSAASATQFVLPETLKCLPVLVQAFLKRRDLEKVRLINGTVEQTLRLFYPRMFSLSDYAVESRLEMTKTLRLSVNSILDDEIYILENSETIFIYIPKGVDRELISKLFEEGENGLVVRKAPERDYRILKEAIESIEMHYNYEIKVFVCPAGAAVIEGAFLMNMVEDKMNDQNDYVDYVFKLHFDVQKG